VTRAVLDTNTIVSGIGWGGTPGAVLDAALAGHFEIVTSPALLDELRRVLAYPKLQAVIGDADELIKLLALAAIVVTPTEAVEIVRDPTTASSKPPRPARPTSSSAAIKTCSPWCTSGRSASSHPANSSSRSTRAPDSRHPGARATMCGSGRGRNRTSSL
jgi:putative PIN family toxin of toxin-antitoxin system